MKKTIWMLLAMVLAMPAWAAYYVAGNGTAGNPWCDGKNWDPKGSQMDENNSITFYAVPAGNYQFKVTTGSWATNYGYNNLNDACTNLETFSGGDGNVVFSTTVQHNITITFDASTKQICLQGDGDEPNVDPSQVGVVGVPGECEDVMLQGFYWNSCNAVTYGGKTTKWASLIKDTAAICHDFDLIWLPPATGGSGVGYYATSYSFQNKSDWGSKDNLLLLIQALRRGGTKAMADIVINHRQSSSGWAKAFSADDFGAQGTFQLTSEHICAGDEAFTDSKSDSRGMAHGAGDTGTNDAGCRDLDHTSPYVQDMCKAYTKYMLDEIGFAGFRYDMVIGYGGNFLSDYNLYSQPYISVGEYWSDLGSTVGYLRSARYNTMVFDFPQKYAIKSAINNASFSGLKSASNSLRGKGLSKYAVTFIDNHDTYGRDNSDYLVKDIKAAGAGRKVLQANAFILSMPGVPCVFYPHWVEYQAAISHLISLRRAAGIHSESEVLDEQAGSKTYSATVQGHRGQLVLRMGANRDTNCPEGFVLMYKGYELDVYLSADCVGDLQLMLAVDQVTEETELPLKVLENGQVRIQRGGHIYSMDGTVLK